MKETISGWQLGLLVTSFVLGTSNVLQLGLNYTGRDTWIAETLSMIIGLIIIFMISYIINKFPAKNAGEIVESLFGTFIAKIIIGILTLFAFILGILILDNIGTFMKTMMMQGTPIWIFIVTISLVTGYILQLGLEVFVRILELVVPVIILIISLLLVLMIIIKIDFNNLTPMFTHELKDISKSTIAISAFPYAEIILLFFIAVNANKKKKAIFKSMATGLIVGGFFLITRPLVVIGVFSFREAARLIYPSFMLVRELTIGEFIERIEISLAMVWFFTTFIKLAVCQYVILQGLKYILNLKLDEYNKLAFPIAILMAPLGMKAYANYQETQLFIRAGWPLIMAPLVLLLLIIFVFSLVKKESS